MSLPFKPLFITFLFVSFISLILSQSVKDIYPTRKDIKGLQPDFYDPNTIILHGVSGVSYNFQWYIYQPEKTKVCTTSQIKYDGYCFNILPDIASQIKTYSDAGVVVTGIFFGSPEWGRRKCENHNGWEEFCAPTDEATEDFGRFVGFIAWYFNGDNGHGRVADFVIHNEVNSAEWFNYGCTAGNCDIDLWTTIYANSYKIAYDYVKMEQKQAKVLISFDHFFGKDLDIYFHQDPPRMSVETFLEYAIPKIGDREWSLAFHSYPTSNTFGPDEYPFVTFGNIGVLAGWLRAHYPLKPHAWEIYLTENGINCNSKELQTNQANLVCQAFKNALGTPGVQSLIYYRLKDHPTELELWGQAFGLWEYDETPKKSWSVFSTCNSENKPSCGFEYLPYIELVRGFSKTKGFHRISTRQLPSDYTMENHWKILREPEEGSQMIFECLNLLNNGKSSFPSIDTWCEGQFSYGPMGYVYKTKKAGTVPLYRCFIAKNGDHFVSIDSKCEGQTMESLLGYGYSI